ncbi:MAG: sensor histidine kinase, partial [Dokdonella sp.]
MSESSSSLLRSLCGLRWLAVAGQLLALLVAAAMGLALPFATLAIAIIVLALFNLYASWRVRQMRVASERETFLHILVDVSVLGWLIAFSGGITNPFVSLFLLPIAFATLALPLRWVWATALACVAGYALSAALGPPLPHVHTALGDSFDVHLWGMAINFLISTAVVLYFFSRLAKNLRRRDQE